ncbi:MAG: LysR substrate-binding domain-containing protein [Acetobacter sp.]|uniref:LysR substrate-binding domain-containing protein n=1 Tax=Acetobacter sp. TaxID=440 RepID=UPI0039EC2A8F
MLQLTQVRCFVAVAEELHFGRAATRLNMTQPPLSRQIQLLEHVLGVELLERTSRVVRLTQAGAVFLAEGRRLLQNAEDATLAARRAGRGTLGQIAIGFTPGCSYDFLPRLISALRSHYPDVDLILEEMITRDQLSALASSRLDIGFIRPHFDAPDIELRRIIKEPMLAAIPEDHPMARLEVVMPSDLDGQELIMYSVLGGGYFHDLVHRLLISSDIRPKLVHHLTQIHALLALVKAGMGVALIPQSASRLGISNVVYRSLGFGADICAELFMAYRADNPSLVLGNVTNVIARFIEEREPSD